MKIIIAGSRRIKGITLELDRMMLRIRRKGIHIEEVIHGDCRGVDREAGRWARLSGIPVRTFPADWKRLGRKAGPVRNTLMVNAGDSLVAFWDSESRGTFDIIEKARRANMPTEVYIYDHRGDPIQQVGEI